MARGGLSDSGSVARGRAGQRPGRGLGDRSHGPRVCPASAWAQIAQLVEHATENRSVAGSIPALGTTPFSLAETIAGTPLVSFAKLADFCGFVAYLVVTYHAAETPGCYGVAPHGNSRLPSRNEPCARRAQKRPRGGLSCAHLRRFAVRGPIPESGHTSHWCGVCSSFTPAVPILISLIPATSILLKPAAGRRGPCGDTAVVVVLERRHEWPSANEP